MSSPSPHGNTSLTEQRLSSWDIETFPESKGEVLNYDDLSCLGLGPDWERCVTEYVSYQGVGSERQGKDEKTRKNRDKKDRRNIK